jgi:hypothetical protein
MVVVEIAGQTIDVPVSLLPDGAGEGSVLRLALADQPDADPRERLTRMQTNSSISDDFSL